MLCKFKETKKERVFKKMKKYSLALLLMFINFSIYAVVKDILKENGILLGFLPTLFHFFTQFLIWKKITKIKA
mgnify:CR=1 FL=1